LKICDPAVGAQSADLFGSQVQQIRQNGRSMALAIGGVNQAVDLTAVIRATAQIHLTVAMDDIPIGRHALRDGPFENDLVGDVLVQQGSEVIAARRACSDTRADSRT